MSRLIERREFLRLLGLGGAGLWLGGCQPYTSPQLPDEVQAKPLPRSTPDRQPESKEVLPVFRIYPLGFHEYKEGEPYAGEGWKWLEIVLAGENTSREWKSFPRLSGEIVTQEGFRYKTMDFVGFVNFLTPYSPDLKGRWRTGEMVASQEKVIIPPGFKLIGFASGEKLTAGPLLALYTRVGAKTTGFRLTMPGHPEIDLKVLPDHRKIDLDDWPKLLSSAGKFPTERPDKDFINLHEPIKIAPHGTLTLKLESANWPHIRLAVTIKNESMGYEQPVSLKFIGVFDDNGMLHLQSGPVYQEFAVGPGITKEEDLYPALGEGVSRARIKNGKIWLSIQGENRLLNFSSVEGLGIPAAKAAPKAR